MITIETIYEGELRTRAKHVYSGSEIITDAPVDNNGKGQAFSPTDLLAAALGSCMLTVMGIAARNNNINIDSARLEIVKLMAPNPRRVAEVQIKIFMPDINYSLQEKRILETAARTCPVALSLHPDLEQKLAFYYSD